MLTCREITESVTEFFEDAMPGAARAAFQRHLRGCPHCGTYVAQIRLVIAALRCTGS